MPVNIVIDIEYDRGNTPGERKNATFEKRSAGVNSETFSRLSFYQRNFSRNQRCTNNCAHLLCWPIEDTLPR